MPRLPARRDRLRLRRATRLLLLYPHSWRARYGEELAELLASEPVTPLWVWYVLVGALDAHLHRRLAGGETRPAAMIVRLAAMTAFCAAVAFVAATLIFYEAINDLSFAAPVRANPELRGPWVVLMGGAAALALAVLAGGLPVLVAVFKETRATHPRDLWLLAVPPLALLALCGCDAIEEARRSAHLALPRLVELTLDVAFHTLFVLATCACVVALCLAVSRSAVAAQLLRFALAPAALATLAMGVAAGAAVIWLARADGHVSGRAGAPLVGMGLAVLVALMGASTALAAGAVARGLMARVSPGAPSRPFA